MSGFTLPAACLCLTAGAALGGLFLLFKLLRGLLYGGRLMTAALDVLFCLIWALSAFICALAADKGRLRLFQLLLQVLGAWGVVVALDPFVEGATGLVRRVGRKLREQLGRPGRLLKRCWRKKRADIIAKRAQKQKTARRPKKSGASRASGVKSKPRYRKVPAKSKIYAPKRKKKKNPLEKLT